jgi:hypothetical protein
MDNLDSISVWFYILKKAFLTKSDSIPKLSQSNVYNMEKATIPQLSLLKWRISFRYDILIGIYVRIQTR